MEKHEFINTILELELAYDNFKISDDKTKLEVWYTYFKNLNNKSFNIVAKKHIIESEKKPTIASLINKTNEIMNYDKNPSSQWNKALNYLLGENLTIKGIMERHGLNEKDELIKALENVGVMRIKRSQEKELPYLYKEFESNYIKELKKSTLSKMFNYNSYKMLEEK